MSGLQFRHELFRAIRGFRFAGRELRLGGRKSFRLSSHSSDEVGSMLWYVSIFKREK
jgi:hypothetical protein